MFIHGTAGNSVCVFVHGFEPYFYVEAPLPQWTPDDSEELCKLLNVSLAASYKAQATSSATLDANQQTMMVTAVLHVRDVQMAVMDVC